MSEKSTHKIKYAVSGITSLNASGKGISSLEGVQYLKSLKFALLTYNQIRDISPLSTLSGLTVLGLGNNKVENIEAVRNLINLKSLTLDNNNPVSLEPITGLTQLKILSLNNIGTFDPDIINRLSSTLSLSSLSLEGNGDKLKK